MGRYARDLNGRDIQHLMRASVSARYVEDALPDAPIHMLSEDASIYSALDRICTAEQLHSVPIATPRASPNAAPVLPEQRS